MATTNTWSSGSGTGSFLDAKLWSLKIAPAAGQFDIVGYGEPTLSNAAVDGFTIDIISAQTLTAAPIVDNATFGNGMLVEDTNSTNGASMLVEGQVTNDGTFLFDASVGGEFNGFSLDFSNNKATLTNNGVITIGSSDGLFLGNGDGGTLVNNGAIFDDASRTFFNSPVDGTGTIGLTGASLELGVGATLGADQTVLFTDGASTLSFNNTSETTSGGLEATVLDFQKGDILDFPLLFLVNPGLSYDASTRTLSVPTDNGTLDVVMGGSTDYTLKSFTEGPDTDDGFEIGTTVSPPCFAAGTRIATERGEVRVEALRIGDLMRLEGGGTAPLTWLGHRRVACRRHGRPADVQPVRVAAHAFGVGRPRRDLLLSPDHAVFVDGVLIPVRYLLNGATLRQEDFLPNDLLARGAAGAWRAAGRGAAGREFPRHRQPRRVRQWRRRGGAPGFCPGGLAARGCAPLVTDGEPRDRVYRRLLAQAFALGWRARDAGGGASAWVAPGRAAEG